MKFSGGELLRSIRKSKKITLVELQLRSGINRELIRRYETGKAVPSGERTLSLLKALGVPEASPEGQSVIRAVISAKQDTALREHVTAPKVVRRSSSKLDRLVDSYFDLSGSNRSEEAEFIVRHTFGEILDNE